MQESLAVFQNKKLNVFGSRVRWCSGKPCWYFYDTVHVFTCTCCAFCSYSKFLIAPLFVTNCRSLLWKSRLCKQFKNCWTGPWKFSQWIYRRLRIMSRARSRATQESSEEIYRRFRFVNSSETFQRVCLLWFSRTEPAERTTKTSSPEQHSAFRELELKFVGASSNTKENLSLQKLASSAPFGFLTSFWLEVLLKYDN